MSVGYGPISFGIATNDMDASQTQSGSSLLGVGFFSEGIAIPVPICALTGASGCLDILGKADDICRDAIEAVFKC